MIYAVGRLMSFALATNNEFVQCFVDLLWKSKRIARTTACFRPNNCHLSTLFIFTLRERENMNGKDAAKTLHESKKENRDSQKLSNIDSIE